AAAGEVAPRDVGGGLLAEDRRVVFPRGHVEEPGARAERRRVPVGPALIAWPGGLSGRLWRRDRAPLGVESAGPVHLYERRAGQERPGLAVENIGEAVAVG